MSRSVQSQHLSAEYDRMLEQKQQIEARERAAVEAPLRAEVESLTAALATAQAERDRLQIVRDDCVAAEVALIAERDAALQRVEAAEASRDEWHRLSDALEATGKDLVAQKWAWLQERDTLTQRAEQAEAETAKALDKLADAQAEVRRLQQEQDRQRIARIEAIEQGNGLAQRLIEQRDAALAERDALKVRDAQWQHKWSTAVGTGTSNTVREADRADAAFAALTEARRVLREVEVGIDHFWAWKNPELMASVAAVLAQDTTI